MQLKRNGASQSLPPALAIVTGTGVIKGIMAEVAYGLFKRNTTNKVFAIHGLGLGRLEDSYAVFEREYLIWTRTLPPGTKPEVVGHSQGAVHALRLGLEHPEAVTSVVCLCGPLDGTKLVDLIPQPLVGIYSWVAPGVLDMGSHSQYLSSLRSRITTSWPASVEVRLVAASWDFLIRPRRSSFELDFPEGSRVERFYLSFFRPQGLPANVEHIRSPSDHLGVLVNPKTFKIVREAA